MKTTLHSSWGWVEIDIITGQVLRLQVEYGGYIDDIDRFDVDEFWQWYNRVHGTEPPWQDDFDILDFGFYNKAGEYIQPDHDYRKFIENKLSGKH